MVASSTVGSLVDAQENDAEDECWRREIIARHGNAAGKVADRCAKANLAAGDREGVAMWNNIATAIRELER